MSHRAISNGQRVLDAKVYLRVFDRGLHFGEAVSTLARVANHRMVFQSLHIQRLRMSMDLLRFSNIEGTLHSIQNAIEQLVGEVPGPASLRVLISSGSSDSLRLRPSNDERLVMEPRWIVLIESTKEPSIECPRVRLESQTRGIDYLSGLALEVKGPFYRDRISALDSHDSQTEVLYLTEEGNALDASFASIGLVDRQGSFCVVPSRVGVLPSITSAFAVAFAEASQRLVRRTMISIGDVYAAQEIGLMSSIRGPAAALEVDGVKCGKADFLVDLRDEWRALQADAQREKRWISAMNDIFKHGNR